MDRLLAVRRVVATVACAAALAPVAAEAQRRVVVNHDEWTLSNTGFGFAGAANAGAFATNVASWLIGGGTGNLLVWSSNFGLNDASVQNALTGAGHTVTNGATAANWANRASFDAILLGGTAVPSNADLVTYVENGGSVYLMGGTGNAGDFTWNPFLARFGLSYDGAYNGIGGILATAAYAGQPPFGAALFTGVAQLFQNNGQTIGTVALPGDVTRQTFLGPTGAGLYAAAELGAAAVVPEPATLGLVAGGLVALAGLARRRRAPRG